VRNEDGDDDTPSVSIRTRRAFMAKKIKREYSLQKDSVALLDTVLQEHIQGWFSCFTIMFVVGGGGENNMELDRSNFFLGIMLHLVLSCLSRNRWRCKVVDTRILEEDSS